KAFEAYKAILSSRGEKASIILSAAINSGSILLVLGLEEEARENMLAGLRIADSINDIPNKLKAYAGMIYVAHSLQEIDYWLAKGDSLINGQDYADAEINLLFSAITQYMDSTDYKKAKPILKKCLALSSQIGSVQISSYNKIYLARIACAEGDPHKALALCREVKPYFMEENAPYSLEIFYDVMSKSFDLLGRQDSALYYLKIKDKYTSQNTLQNPKVDALLQYVKYKTKLEQDTLLKSKESAEALVKESRARQVLVYWLSGSVILLLGSIALFLFRLYRQKEREEHKLAAANERLSAERENLQRANAKLRRFSGIVSHDILSNLDLILSSGHVLAGPEAPKESLLRYYDMTHQTSGQLKNYCLRLLDEARKDNHDSTLLTDPMPGAYAALARFGNALREANFRVDVEDLPPSPLPSAVTEQVFHNLISNALRYASQSAQPLLRIAKGSSTHGSWCWVVEDNGSGIAPEQLSTIFSTSGANAKGWGVGLTQVYEALQEYGLDIQAGNAPRGGAKFVIRLNK
ncbi:MAG TPA: ATP-binding protein, partial [Saprospiraceae bacterium]|nr:ATP-binding protein [Saprospiraceae bacterium]